MKTVLLTNGQQRKTLAAARSLGKRGVNVIVAEETRLNVSAFSRYCKKSLVYPSPKHNPDEFYHWLMSAISKYTIHVIFPMDDDTLDVVMKHFEYFSKCCTITLPDHKSYETACDKGKAVKLAYEAGVPITQLSVLLGHATIATTQTYLNLDLDLDTTASDFIPW